jgi:23S rRNA maturation-related 3'-5' exoribonuclease YhaM
MNATQANIHALEDADRLIRAALDKIEENWVEMPKLHKTTNHLEKAGGLLEDAIKQLRKAVASDV